MTASRAVLTVLLLVVGVVLFVIFLLVNMGVI